MIHSSKVAFVLGTLSCLLPAQNNRDLFWPRETTTWAGVSFATRYGGANTAVVELLQDRSALLARGLGSSTSTSCSLSGMRYVVQDQDRSTSNPFAILGRKAVAADGAADTTGYIFKTGTINTPAGGTGGVAWFYTSTFAAPLPTLPCEDGYYLGVEHQPQTSATDLTYGWTASAFNASASSGTNPRLPTPKFHAGWVTGTPLTFTRVTSSDTVAINGIFTTPTINVANVDGTLTTPYICYGLGGAYPDCTGASTPTDGIEIRVQDDSQLGGVGAIFLSTGYFAGGLSVPGISGAVWLNPIGLTQLANFALPAAVPATVTTTIAPPGVIPAVTGLQLTFQAVTASSTLTNGRLTNAVSTNL